MSDHPTLKEHLQLFLTIFAALSAVIGIIGWSFLRWSEWEGLPGKVRDVQVAVTEIRSSLGASRPQLLEFKGGGVVASGAVEQGGSITVVYVLRRVIDCPTDIVVRFYDHARNIVNARHSYVVPATRSPVSLNYSTFPIPVTIPVDLPPGVYSYFPEIIPKECGIYGAFVPPISEAFEVVAK